MISGTVTVAGGTDGTELLVSGTIMTGGGSDDVLVGGGTVDVDTGSGVLVLVDVVTVVGGTTLDVLVVMHSGRMKKLVLHTTPAAPSWRGMMGASKPSVVHDTVEPRQVLVDGGAVVTGGTVDELVGGSVTGGTVDELVGGTVTGGTVDVLVGGSVTGGTVVVLVVITGKHPGRSVRVKVVVTQPSVPVTTSSRRKMMGGHEVDVLRQEFVIGGGVVGVVGGAVVELVVITGTHPGTSVRVKILVTQPFEPVKTSSRRKMMGGHEVDVLRQLFVTGAGVVGVVGVVGGVTHVVLQVVKISLRNTIKVGSRLSTMVRVSHVTFGNVGDEHTTGGVVGTLGTDVLVLVAGWQLAAVSILVTHWTETTAALKNTGGQDVWVVKHGSAGRVGVTGAGGGVVGVAGAGAGVRVTGTKFVSQLVETKAARLTLRARAGITMVVQLTVGEKKMSEFGTRNDANGLGPRAFPGAINDPWRRSTTTSSTARTSTRAGTEPGLPSAALALRVGAVGAKPILLPSGRVFLRKMTTPSSARDTTRQARMPYS